MILCARQCEFVFPGPALVMGVLNVTPDSFSDGGRFMEPKAAIAHAMNMVEQGAGIIDVGGESTRPGAEPVPETEELRRVMPVIEGLARRLEIPISIDTTKPGVARAALAAGASIVNDVAANREDETMWRLVAETGAGYICTHMKGTPQTMQKGPVYQDVAGEVMEFFAGRLGRLRGCAVMPEQIILDVGIGFGKTPEHNVQLLGALGQFKRLARPLLLGVSRKAFLGRYAAGGAQARLAPALACACLGVESGANVIRTHDVAETVAAIRMTEAIMASRKP